MPNVCAYCGVDSATTVDHVPPRGIFSKPRPSNPITVPACENCNCGESKDDEYFKTMVSAMGDAGGNDAASQIYKKVLKSLDRPQASGYKQAIIDSMELLENGKVLNAVDANRIHSVVDRTAVGLNFHHIGELLPSNYSVESFILDRNQWPTEENLLTLIALAAKTEPAVIKDGEFSYWRLPCDSDAHTCFYVFEFYGRICFGALITQTVG